MPTLDSRYQVAREVSREGFVSLYQVRLDTVEGRLYWFDVHSPEARTAFHRYRNALKALEAAGALPQGMEISANPGRYYVFWPQLLPRTARRALVLPWIKVLAPFGYGQDHFQVGDQAGKLRVADLEPLASQPPEFPAARPGPKVSRSWVSWWPGLLLGALGLALGILGVQNYLNPPSSVLPLLLGQTSEQAREALRGSGVRLEYTEGSDLDQPRGVVIAQDPEALTQVKPGRRVVLVINNPKLGVVGQLEGRSLEDAQSGLQALRYQVGAVATTYSSLPRNIVLASTPPAGTPLPPGATVDLLVSAGPVPRKVPPLPDLVGLTLEQAQKRLTAGGWKLKLLQVASGAAGNTVIAQNPSEGSLLAENGTVTLTVSLPMTVSLPQTQPYRVDLPPLEPDPVADPPLLERRIPLSIEPIPALGQRVRLVLMDAVGERVLFDEIVPNDFVFEADQGLLVSGSAVIELFVGDQLLRQWNYP
jgi:beta-lactam-binding protein with PASTA domain